ncbi:protein of unknown function, partial [Pseudomonas inefficax]
MRHHAIRLAVRHGWHDRLSGGQRVEVLPRRFRADPHGGRAVINFFDPASDKSSDLGTPARDSEVQISLSIDGRAITVPAGTSVMRAAAMLGTSIPKLCATDSLEAFGSCRMCMVEIEGMRGYPASCTTPVSEGMVVHTETPRLAGLRRNVMELYISDHPLDCLTCSANGNC